MKLLNQRNFLFAIAIISFVVETNAQKKLTPYQINGKWGAKDSSGTIMIPFIYDHLSSVQSGRFFVGQIKKDSPHKGWDSLYGLYDSKGQELCKPKYDRIKFLVNYKIITLERKRCGRSVFCGINYNGDKIIKTKKTTILSQNNELYRFINSRNKVYLLENDSLIPVSYSFDSIISVNNTCYNCEQIVRTGKKNSKVRTYTYRYIQNIGEGNYKVLKLTQARIKFIYKSNCVILRAGALIGVINTKGKIAGNRMYDEIGPFYSGYSRVRKNRKFGLIDMSGNLIANTVYIDIPVKLIGSMGRYNYYYFHPFAKIKSDSGWQLINHDGQFVCNTFYDSICDYENNNLCKVLKDGKWGIIDGDGKEILPLLYEDIKFIKFCASWPIASDGEPHLSSQRFRCKCRGGKAYYIINRMGEDAEKQIECEEDKDAE